MGENDKTDVTSPIPDGKPPDSTAGNTPAVGDTTTVDKVQPGQGTGSTEPPIQLPTKTDDKKEGDVSANSSGTQRTDATTTSTSGGGGTGPEGHKATGVPGDGSGDSGQDGQSAGAGAKATKVTPSTAADKL